MFLIYGAGLILLHFVIRFAPISAHKLSKEIFFFSIVVVSIFFYNQSRKLSIKFLIPLLAFFGIGYFVTEDFTNIFFWTQFQAFSFFLIMFYLISTHKGDDKIIVNFISLSCILESIWCIFEKLEINLYSVVLGLISDSYHVSNLMGYQVTTLASGLSSGSLNQPNSSGAYIAVSMMFLLRSKWKFFVPLAFISLFTTSLLPIVTACLGLLYFVGINHKQKYVLYIVFIILSTLLCIYGFPFDIDNGRWVVWKKVFELNDSVYFGNGFGEFAINFHQKAKLYLESQLIFRNTHNEFVQLFYNFGFIGFAIVLFLFFSLTKTNNKVYLSALFAIFVNCFGNFYFHTPQLSFLACLIFALSYRESV